MRFDNYESDLFKTKSFDSDYRFQKTVKTNQDKPKRQDDSKSKERKKNYSEQRNMKRGEQQ